ncbi:MAG: limonene-1,2-epoxide hydrolase family protein [Gordonia sp. (in: high G+C Gram-positive bacteria)]|uniref:limonene-1,2-epoxide hydrolase family protein n=1 Tax=Gordonia sp. (in: high G+C Gram-positive bacteria) TaxID=84139 RepID=UPI0039E513EF
MATADDADIELTLQFLRDMANLRVDDALAVVADDIVHKNGDLPTVRGKARFARVMRRINSPLVHFDAEITNIAAADGVVLNERIDLLRVGPLRLRFWVCGRFTVRDGLITEWVDYFDMVDVAKAVVRGVVGLVIPRAVRPIHSTLTADAAASLPAASTAAAGTADSAAIDLTTDFLRDLALGRVDDAVALVDDDLLYQNVGLPDVRGKQRFTSVMRGLESPRVGFDVEIDEAVAADGVVLNERIDELRFGPLRLRFWVFGRFEVRDGRIVVWRDHFDTFNMVKALGRGVVGIALPRALKPIRSVTGA